MSANPGALPGWFNRRKRNETATDAAQSTDEASSQTTSTGGQQDQTPVVVWEAANRMEAEIVAGRLHSEGIPAIIRGEVLGTIYGLTTGTLAAATVLVPAALADKAVELLADAVEWDESDQADDADTAAGDVDDSDVTDGDVD